MHLESFNEVIKEAFQASAQGKKVTTNTSFERPIQDAHGNPTFDEQGRSPRMMVLTTQTVQMTETDPIAQAALLSRIIEANMAQLRILGIVGWTRIDKEMMDKVESLEEKVAELKELAMTARKDKLLP